VDSPSRDNKKKFCQANTSKRDSICCTCYHNRALFSHPTEDNKNDIRQKEGAMILKKITIATNKQICRKS
jgi:hypothetical protein